MIKISKLRLLLQLLLCIIMANEVTESINASYAVALWHNKQQCTTMHKKGGAEIEREELWLLCAH
jgi:hypothetical protein